MKTNECATWHCYSSCLLLSLWIYKLLPTSTHSWVLFIRNQFWITGHLHMILLRSWLWPAKVSDQPCMGPVEPSGNYQCKLATLLLLRLQHWNTKSSAPPQAAWHILDQIFIWFSLSSPMEPSCYSDLRPDLSSLWSRPFSNTNEPRWFVLLKYTVNCWATGLAELTGGQGRLCRVSLRLQEAFHRSIRHTFAHQWTVFGSKSVRSGTRNSHQHREWSRDYYSSRT